MQNGLGFRGLGGVEGLLGVFFPVFYFKTTGTKRTQRPPWQKQRPSSVRHWAFHFSGFSARGLGLIWFDLSDLSRMGLNELKVYWKALNYWLR